MDTPAPFDWRRLRGLLAERRISHKQFASTCHLNHTFLSRILCGHQPGELAHIKIERGMARLGISLDREAPRAS